MAGTVCCSTAASQIDLSGLDPVSGIREPKFRGSRTLVRPRMFFCQVYLYYRYYYCNTVPYVISVCSEFLERGSIGPLGSKAEF
jgi:hypothetical protein